MASDHDRTSILNAEHIDKCERQLTENNLGMSVAICGREFYSISYLYYAMEFDIGSSSCASCVCSVDCDRFHSFHGTGSKGLLDRSNLAFCGNSEQSPYRNNVKCCPYTLNAIKSLAEIGYTIYGLYRTILN